MSFDLKEWDRQRREREAREKQMRAKGYKGNVQWMVVHELIGAVSVLAPDRAAALYTAANVWGVDAKKVDFHQNVRVMKVGRENGKTVVFGTDR